MSEDAHIAMASKLRGYIALAFLLVGLAGVALGYIAIAAQAVAAFF